MFSAAPCTARVLQLSSWTLGFMDSKSTLFTAVDTVFRRMVILEFSTETLRMNKVIKRPIKEIRRPNREMRSTNIFQPAVDPETLGRTIS